MMTLGWNSQTYIRTQNILEGSFNWNISRFEIFEKSTEFSGIVSKVSWSSIDNSYIFSTIKIVSEVLFKWRI